MAIAGIPSSAVRSASAPSLAAPSSMEYSVCTWRWTNESWEPVAIVAGRSSIRIVRACSIDHGRWQGGDPGGRTPDYATVRADGGRPHRQSETWPGTGGPDDHGTAGRSRARLSTDPSDPDDPVGDGPYRRTCVRRLCSLAGRAPAARRTAARGGPGRHGRVAQAPRPRHL